MTTSKRFHIQLLGELRAGPVGGPTALPRSRQTRALLLYLALEERRPRRDELCDLLFELPNDPRAALRWSLSKLRPHLADEETNALVADREAVSLDRDLVSVDVHALRDALDRADLEPTDDVLIETERRLAAGYPVDLDDVGSVEFGLWLNAEREALRALQRRVIEALCSRASLPADQRMRLLGKRIAIDPFDVDANIDYLRAELEQRGLSEATRVFDGVRAHHRDEGRPDGALVAAWMQLVADARAGGDPVAAGASASAAAHETSPFEEPDGLHPLPDKPSLAVLDFGDIGAHSEGAILANGLTVDLNSRLAQLSNLFVIARASSARIFARSLAPRDIGRKLGVRYLVNGTTQRHDDRVRITVTLLDATDESEIWSEHYDRPLADLFEVQDDITRAVVAAVEPAIERAEMQRALLAPPDGVTAWEAYHRGLWHCFRFTAHDSEAAHRWFERALQLDPRFSRAYAGRSFVHYSRAFLDTVPDIEGATRAALEAAQQSVGLDARDAMGYWSLGRALFLSRRHDEALAAIDEALAINPNYAQGHYARGFVGVHSGIDESSLDFLDHAQRLSPFDPLLFAMKSSRAISLALRGRTEEAAPWAIRATHEPNAHFHIYAVAAAVLELAGRHEDARNNARWALERRPDYSVEVFRRSFPHKDEAAREPLLAALERAGVPRSR